jgi:hypothetical protein
LDPLALALAAILTGLSFLLLMQMLITYSRVRNVKVILLAAGFALFFVEGLLVLIAQTGAVSLPAFAMSRELLLVNLFVLVFLYAGTVKS